MGQPKIFSAIDKAVYEYNLIEENDRILLGVSGGKDSTVLAEYLASRKKRGRENFSFTCLHVQSDFAMPFSESLENLFSSWGISVQKVNVDVLQRLKPGKKMSCWWCSLQRRTELNNYAIQNGFNKIALAHHLDDILETLLMNALNKCELATMTPRLEYKKYPVTVIRPLCFVDEQAIINYVKQKGYDAMTCTCDYQNNSSRKLARSRLERLTEGDVNLKRHLFSALQNVKTEYLP